MVHLYRNSKNVYNRMRVGSQWTVGGEKLWKSRCVENQKQVFHSAWKSRNVGGIPTFPQLRRRRVINLNRTFHLLPKADILIC